MQKGLEAREAEPKAQEGGTEKVEGEVQGRATLGWKERRGRRGCHEAELRRGSKGEQLQIRWHQCGEGRREGEVVVRMEAYSHKGLRTREALRADS